MVGPATEVILESEMSLNCQENIFDDELITEIKVEPTELLERYDEHSEILEQDAIGPEQTGWELNTAIAIESTELQQHSSGGKKKKTEKRRSVCPYGCGTIFNTLSPFVRHLTMKICQSKGLPNIVNVISNEKNVELPERTMLHYECGFCGKRYSKLAYYERHRLKCTKKTRMCCFLCNCDDRFPSVRDLELHMAIHKDKLQSLLTNQQHILNLYDRTVRRLKKAGLKKISNLLHHSEDPTEDNSFDPEKTVAKKLTDKSEHSKHLPEAKLAVSEQSTLQSSTNLPVNTQTPSVEISSNLEQLPSNNAATQPNAGHTGLPIYCERCGLTYVNEGMLMRHKRQCYNPALTSCHLCPTVCESSTELRLHLNIHDKKQSKCKTEGCRMVLNQCGHGPPLIFYCNICGNPLRSSYSLRIHMILHSEPKPKPKQYPRKSKKGIKRSLKSV